MRGKALERRAQNPIVTRLSVIVPATDRPLTLERCVAAIRAGLGPEDELQVVTEPAADETTPSSPGASSYEPKVAASLLSSSNAARSREIASPRTSTSASTKTRMSPVVCAAP